MYLLGEGGLAAREGSRHAQHIAQQMDHPLPQTLPKRPACHLVSVGRLQQLRQEAHDLGGGAGGGGDALAAHLVLARSAAGPGHEGDVGL